MVTLGLPWSAGCRCFSTSMSALAMLSRLFRHGKLKHHGAFFNAVTGQMSVPPIDPELWRRTEHLHGVLPCGSVKDSQFEFR